MDRHPMTVTLHSQLGPSATGVDTATVIHAPRSGRWHVDSIHYSALANVTGANANSRTLKFINHKQNGAGTVVIAQLPVVLGVNLTAFDDIAVPLSSTPADLILEAGDVIEMVSTHIGAGLAGPGGTAVITLSLTD